MFTGIVTNTSFLIDKNKSRYTFQSSLKDIHLGESLCHGGICLTVSHMIDQENGIYCIDVSHETVEITTVHKWEIGDDINLERSLKAHSVIGGHYVTGHVDSLGYVSSMDRIGDNVVFVISPHNAVSYKYIAKKGSIAVDGVSLTVNNVEKDNFSVCIVPHTYNNTSFKKILPHSLVNIEYDIFAKYIVSYMENR